MMSSGCSSLVPKLQQMLASCHSSSAPLEFLSHLMSVETTNVLGFCCEPKGTAFMCYQAQTSTDYLGSSRRRQKVHCPRRVALLHLFLWFVIPLGRIKPGTLDLPVLLV